MIVASVESICIVHEHSASVLWNKVRKSVLEDGGGSKSSAFVILSMVGCSQIQSFSQIIFHFGQLGEGDLFIL